MDYISSLLNTRKLIIMKRKRKINLVLDTVNQVYTQNCIDLIESELLEYDVVKLRKLSIVKIEQLNTKTRIKLGLKTKQDTESNNFLGIVKQDEYEKMYIFDKLDIESMNCCLILDHSHVIQYFRMRGLKVKETKKHVIIKLFSCYCF